MRLAAGLSNDPTDWDRYVEALGYGFPNEGEFRLFPLVQSNLGAGFEGGRAAWFADQNQRSMNAASRNAGAQQDVKMVLNDHGIRARWTKGTALADEHYDRREDRPSGDIDLIVHFDDVFALTAAMIDAGWKKKPGPTRADQHTRFSGHGITLEGHDGAEIDMVWSPRLSFAYDPWVAEWLFSEGPDITNVNPTWLLIEAIDHGLSANRVWPIRWVVDALKLLEHPNQIEWDTLLYTAERYHLRTILLAGLETINDFSGAIPATVIKGLCDLPANRLHEDELVARGTLDNPFDNFVVSRRYNLAIRAPLKHYRLYPQAPFDRIAGQSGRLRLALAAKNLASRTRYPFGAPSLV